jgi:hypothetical protein
MGHRNPSFITPMIKSCLRGNFAGGINKLIDDVRRKRYAGLVNANAEELWAAVKGKLNKNGGYVHILSSPELVDQFFFMSIATDND